MIIYETVIEHFGEQAQDFLKDGMFIIFENNAPEELKEFCFLHSQNCLNSEIKDGDTLYIDNQQYEIEHVGEVVNKNLSELGHITFSFKGDYTNGSLGGTLYLKQSTNINLTKGSSIKIVRS